MSPVGPVAEEGRGQPFLLTPPLPAARLSVYRGKALPDFAYEFFILSNKHLLSTYAVLGTGEAVQNTQPRAPIRPPEGSAWISPL